MKTINTALAGPEKGNGLTFKITSLQGSIPANFKFGLQGYDAQGLWLNAPSNIFIWNWTELPGVLRISTIEASDIDLLRLPDMPPDHAQSKPNKPLDARTISGYIKTAGDFLAKSHWWLPDVALDRISASALLPLGLLPGKEPQRQLVQTDASLNFKNNNFNADATLNLASQGKMPVLLPSVSLDNLAMQLSANAAPAPNGLELKCAFNALVEKPRIEAADLPSNFLGESSSLAVSLTAEANTRQDPPSFIINMEGPNLNAGKIALHAQGDWAIPDTWVAQGLSGPLNYQLNLQLQPLDDDPGSSRSPLAALKSPAQIALNVDGDFPELKINLDLDCEKIMQSGISIQDTRLGLASEKLFLPLPPTDSSLALLEENRLELRLSSSVDGNPVKLDSQIFFQKLASTAASWRIGLRNLQANALSASMAGNISGILLKDQKPALDGSLKLSVMDFASFNKFLPGKKLAGNAMIEADFASSLPDQISDPALAARATVPDDHTLHQNGVIKLAVPNFRLSEKKPLASIDRLTGEISLADIFQAPAINGRLNAAAVEAAGLKIKADIAAQGSLKERLKASLKTEGSIVANVAAQMQPGLVQLESFNIQANLAPFLQKSGSTPKMAGIRSNSAASIAYGTSGISVRNLDLDLLPAGKLKANGGLGPDKLDLRFSLDGLNLEKWRMIAPQLPGGSISLAGKFAGDPKRPAGDFRVALTKITIPKSPLPPLSMALLGDIKNGASGSLLTARLDMAPETIRAMGGSTAQFTASLPLIFGRDGVPAPNMSAPIAAKIRWDGSLWPIWNLLPIPDQRLNGKIAVNIDAAGSLQKPRLNGQAAITGGRYENLALGILLADINLKLDLVNAGKPGAVKGPMDNIPGLARIALNMSDGRGGYAKAEGTAALDGSKIDLGASINRLRPLRRRDIHIDLSGNAKITGQATAPRISGEIFINQGEVLLNNLEMTGSVTTLPITAATAPQQAPKAAPVKKESGSLDVRVVMAPRFVVEGRGLASTWRCNLLITGPLENPQVLGQIDCVRGNFDFLGKVFALTKGIVFFGGGSLSDPLVDIDLTHETDDLTAHIIVSGPVNKIRIRITSDPEVPRDEIISRVLFGRSVNDLSRMEMLQLAGAVAQLAGFGGGTSILGKAKKALGVDVLRIGTADTASSNESNEDTGGGTTLEMGKYLNDYIYMGIQQGLASDSTAFILEIELSPHSNLELKTEQNNTWGGFKWKMNY